MSSPLMIPVGQLVVTLGLPDALQLVSHFGGRMLYLPHPSRLRPGNKVAEAIGFEAAKKLCAEFPGLDLRVPRLARELRRMRDRAIRAETAAGASAGDLATKYLCTDRTIQRARSGQDDEPEASPASAAQRSLF